MANVYLIERGIPGPPGSGVTALAWNAIRADVDGLQADVYRGLPIRKARHVAVIGSFANAVGGLMGDPTVTVSGLSALKKHRILARGEIRVTTAASKTAQFVVNLFGSGNASDVGIAGAGGVSVPIFYGAWDLPAGPTSYGFGIWWQTSDGTAALLQDAELEIEVYPLT